VNDIADGADRTRQWNEWELRFWATVESALGSAGSGGAARLFQGVWLMLNPIDVGIINVGICRAPVHGESRVWGNSFNARWETDPADGVADWAIRYVRRVLEDQRF